MTFADEDVIRMLKNEFVPVAIDQWYQRKQQDTEGEFYRKVASQGPRNNFQQTTQGHYVCSPDGTLLGFTSYHVSAERTRAMMKKAIESFDSKPLASLKMTKNFKIDSKYRRDPPEGGLHLRVFTKVLSGYESPDQSWKTAMHKSVGRDNAWFKAGEKISIERWINKGGQFPEKLLLRLARFSLNDNTRGEPDRWTAKQVRVAELSIDSQGKMTGRVHLETENGKRGYVASLIGMAKTSEDGVVRFDLLAKGEYWGSSRFTHGAPKGKFPLVVALELSDGSESMDRIPPHGGKGWMAGYYE